MTGTTRQGVDTVRAHSPIWIWLVNYLHLQQRQTRALPPGRHLSRALYRADICLRQERSGRCRRANAAAGRVPYLAGVRKFLKQRLSGLSLTQSIAFGRPAYAQGC